MAGDRSLLYSMDEGMSELYDLSSDPGQRNNLISQNSDMEREDHQSLVKFMKETNVGEHMLKPRMELNI